MSPHPQPHPQPPPQPTDVEGTALAVLPRPSTFLAALVDGGGAVPAELGAVRRLVARGHRVVVLADGSMADEVRATGAELRPWAEAPNRPDRRPESDPVRDWECTGPSDLVDRMIERRLVGPAAGYAADTARALRVVRPDAVLASAPCLGAMVAAESSTVPLAVLMPSAYLRPGGGRAPAGTGRRPARTPIGGARHRVAERMAEQLWSRARPGLDAVRAGYGLAPVAGIHEQLDRADRHIVMTSPAFDFATAVPDRVRYVGPVLDDPAWVEPWTPPPGDGPLVLVAMSSTFQDQVGCLQMVIDVLASMPVRGVVTTGPAVDPAWLRPTPNVTVVRSAPHAQVLAHAAAVVTHGGHGTVLKALAADVPLLLVPHGRDQADNAARVVGRSAGRAIARTASPAAMAKALGAVLSDIDLRNGASLLGSAIRADAARGALVHELEALPGVRPWRPVDRHPGPTPAPLLSRAGGGDGQPVG